MQYPLIQRSLCVLLLLCTAIVHANITLWNRTPGDIIIEGTTIPQHQCYVILTTELISINDPLNLAVPFYEATSNRYSFAFSFYREQFEDNQDYNIYRHIERTSSPCTVGFFKFLQTQIVGYALLETLIPHFIKNINAASAPEPGKLSLQIIAANYDLTIESKEQHTILRGTHRPDDLKTAISYVELTSYPDNFSSEKSNARSYVTQYNPKQNSSGALLIQTIPCYADNGKHLSPTTLNDPLIQALYQWLSQGNTIPDDIYKTDLMHAIPLNIFIANIDRATVSKIEYCSESGLPFLGINYDHNHQIESVTQYNEDATSSIQSLVIDQPINSYEYLASLNKPVYGAYIFFKIRSSLFNFYKHNMIFSSPTSFQGYDGFLELGIRIGHVRTYDRGTIAPSHKFFAIHNKGRKPNTSIELEPDDAAIIQAEYDNQIEKIKDNHTPSRLSRQHGSFDPEKDPVGSAVKERNANKELAAIKPTPLKFPDF